MKSASPFRYLPPELAESARHLEITVRRPVQGPQEGLHRSPDFGSSVEFAEYREYSPGDPVSLIDWAVYARSDRTVIRRFHEETNLRAYVLLDTSESLAFQDEGPMTKLDYARFLAAGLMFALVHQGDTVGLMTFDGRVQRTFEPVGTVSGLRPLLLGLEDLRAGGRSDIESSMHQAAGLLRGRSLVIMLSDFLEEARRVTRGIRHLFHDGHNLKAIQVLDRAERRLSIEGQAEFRELETGARLVVEIAEIREAYRAAVDRHVGDLRGACAECLADYHLIDTRTPVDEALHGLRSGGGR